MPPPGAWREGVGSGTASTTRAPERQKARWRAEHEDSPGCPNLPAALRSIAERPRARAASAGCAARHCPASSTPSYPGATAATRWAGEKPCTGKRCAALLRRTHAETRRAVAVGRSWERLEKSNKLLWSQAMTVFLPPALQHVATTRSLHSDTETMRLGPAPSVRLKGTFQRPLLPNRNSTPRLNQ